LIAGRAVVFNEYESACDSPPTKKKKEEKQGPGKNLLTLSLGFTLNLCINLEDN
jgi:hypothetical protein